MMMLVLSLVPVFDLWFFITQKRYAVGLAPK